MCFLRLAALDTPGAQPAVHLRSQETGHWPGPHKPTEVSTATASAEHRMTRVFVNWWIFLLQLELTLQTPGTSVATEAQALAGLCRRAWNYRPTRHKPQVALLRRRSRCTVHLELALPKETRLWDGQGLTDAGGAGNVWSLKTDIQLWLFYQKLAMSQNEGFLYCLGTSQVWKV